jgi:hypothetical protein
MPKKAVKVNENTGKYWKKTGMMYRKDVQCRYTTFHYLLEVLF